MPKSKRNKQVDLSKTKKHGLEGKKKLYEEVRSCVETYTHLFIFSVNDMRNSKIKSVREQWKHSRFFIGKNKVMAKALGMSAEDEFRMNLHKIGHRLKGERGLFFSNQSIEEVLKWFSSYSEGDFARSGNRATETVILQEGPLSQFPHNLEPYLRQLGLPTALNKGVIHLVKDHTVCNVGDILTPETAKIVKLLGYEMADFYIKIECVWSQDGSFSDFTTGEESKENINRANSSSLSIQTPNNVASMDVDDVDVAEPSDEMIENIIMKNRRSLMDNKIKQLENEASSSGSSDEEEMADFAELKTTGKKATLEKSNELSSDTVEKDLPDENDAVQEVEQISATIAEGGDKDVEISEIVEDAQIITNNAGSSEKDVENSKITTNVVSGDKSEEISESVEDTKTTTNNDENENISELVQNTETATDESESSEEEEIPELVADDNASMDNLVDQERVVTEKVGSLLNNTQNMVENNESNPTNENSIKRLSLDKNVLQSPVMLEKRPKYSPKMTRSAMKAKKTVSKINSDKVEVNDELKSLMNEVKEGQQQKGRSQKKHSSGESPAERTLRNRSIKIVKRKK